MLTPEEEAHKAKLLQELKDLEGRARVRATEQAKIRKYSFLDVKDPEILKKLKRFQSIFGRYIPELIDDEHATIHLHSRISGGLFINPAETYDKSTFEEDVKRFRKAIETLAEFSIWGTKPCIFLACSEAPVGHEEITSAAKQIYDCILTIQSLDTYPATLERVLDELEGWAVEASKDLFDRRNINWEGVHAVEVLRGFWESWTETPAPRRALNPASPFADYLRDAFGFFGIQGDPCAAFRRWVALEDEDPNKWK